MLLKFVNENKYESLIDIWALNYVVVEMLTRRPAWDFQLELNIYFLLFQIGNGDYLSKIPYDCQKKRRIFQGNVLLRILENDGLED